MARLEEGRGEMSNCWGDVVRCDVMENKWDYWKDLFPSLPFIHRLRLSEPFTAAQGFKDLKRR